MNRVVPTYYSLDELQTLLRLRARFWRDVLADGHLKGPGIVQSFGGDVRVPEANVLAYMNAHRYRASLQTASAAPISVIERHYKLTDMELLHGFTDRFYRDKLKAGAMGPCDRCLFIGETILVPASGWAAFLLSHPHKPDLGTKARNRAELQRKVLAHREKGLAHAA